MSDSDLEKLMSEGESLSKEYNEKYREKVRILEPKIEKLKNILKNIPDSKYINYIYNNGPQNSFLFWDGVDLFIKTLTQDKYKEYKISVTIDVPSVFLNDIEKMTANLLNKVNQEIKGYIDYINYRNK